MLAKQTRAVLGGKKRVDFIRQQHVASKRNVTTTVANNYVQQETKRISNERLEDSTQTISAATPLSTDKCQARLEHLNLWHSIETVKKLGHRLARLDPLKLDDPLSLKSLTWNHELIEELKSKQDIVPTSAFLNTKQPFMSVKELFESVWNIYADSECGLEFTHLSNQEEIEWLTSHWEKYNEIFHFDQAERQQLAKLLLECETFDHFMATKYPTTKRYGCEGAESMLVAFDEILRLCHLGESDLDEMTSSIGSIDDVIIGMPHRGRLNLLACVLGFEPEAIFNKTRGEPELDLREAWMAKGDVLSHLSTNVRFVYGLNRHNIGLSRDTPNPINVTLLPNPSHLEISSPMVCGSARGRAHNIYHGYSSSPKFVSLTNGATKASDDLSAKDQRLYYRKHFSTILPIQVHGDAAVAGQGIVQETLQMANLPMFTVGGSLHLVVNNQIGYTTDSSHGRSTHYCTDIFKLIEAPIIHVNGQNIESVIRATRLALAYRQKFGKDVAIDLIGYRQHGHNELDEPSFTQPLMYESIRNRKSIPQTYCDMLGLNKQERDRLTEVFKQKLQDAYKKSATYKPDNDNYRNFSLPTEYHRDHICEWQTGCQLESLKSVALSSIRTPKDFNIHPNLKRVLVADRESKFSVDSSKLKDVKVDWATAEILAFGSLLNQHHTVRLAGQDVARGTFSTRHAVLFDQKTGKPFIPLNNMATEDSNNNNNQLAQIEVANTILSEEAALAYEYAFSTETCALTIWEAQFGDFFNTAQSIIDTLVSSSESKWLKQSPLTLLLPHGLDGAGPEHSSSHIERFLQLSSSSTDSLDTEARVNWSIVFPTLPGQYFHLLRRQVLRPFRKPLVVMSPKIIFRHPDCVSELSEFDLDKSFKPVLDDPSVKDANNVDTIVFCSGKVYFMLKEQKVKEQIENVAIIRLEELCPFPLSAIVQHIKKYPNVDKNNLIWLQEEHKNQGAYSFVNARFVNMTGVRSLAYIGRAESELPATGSSSLHKKELEQLIKDFVALKRKY